MKLRRRRSGYRFTERDRKLFRAHRLALLREEAISKTLDFDREYTRPAWMTPERQQYLEALKNDATEACAIFRSVYQGRHTEDVSALDTRATFHEAYSRAKGSTHSAEVHLMTVTHRRGCGERFKLALPGTHKLVAADDGAEPPRVRARCPHCGEDVTVKMPEGTRIARADEQDDMPPLGREGEGNLRDEEDEEFRGDEGEGYDSRTGPTPPEEPSSGPYRPGSGVRDSVRDISRSPSYQSPYYAPDRPEKLVRLAKKEAGTRLGEAAAVFLRMLDREQRRMRD